MNGANKVIADSIVSNISKRGRALVALAALSLTSSAFGGLNQWTAIGPEGGYIDNVAITAGTPARTYATAGSLYVLDDTTQTWSRSGSQLGINSIATHPINSNSLFVATSGRLFSSTDGGTTRVDITPPGAPPIFDVKVSADGTVLYAAGPSDIYRSTNLGTTWTPGDTLTPDISSLYVDPTNAQRLIAMVFGPFGGSLALTTDGGDSWTTVPQPSEISAVNGLAFSGSAGLWIATPEGLWNTSDDGANWTASTLTGITSAVAVHPSNPSIVYAQQDHDIYRSTDGGIQWTLANGIVGLRRVNAFVFDPQNSDHMFAAASPGAWVSVDGGVNWSELRHGMNATSPSRFSSSTDRTYFAVAEQMHYIEAGASTTVAIDQMALRAALKPVAPGMNQLISLHAEQLNSANARIFAGGLGGGLARSIDGGQTWSRLTHPLMSTRVLGLARANALFAATANGILRSTDDGDTWSTTTGANAFISLVTKQYAVGGGRLYRTSDDGLNWVQVTATGINPAGITSLHDSGGNPTYVGTSAGAFKTTDDGASWTRLPVSGTGTFCVSQSASGLYVTRREGVAVSSDDGNTWTEVTRLPQGVNVIEVYIDPTTSGRVLVATPNNGVYEYMH